MRKLSQYLPVIVGVAIGVTLLAYASYKLQSSVLTDGDPIQGWFTVVNLHHNAFHTWRLDHPSQLAAFLWDAKQVAETPLVDLCILLVGTALFIQMASNLDSATRNPYATYAASIPALLVLLSTGLDPVVLGTLAWIPLLAVCGLYILSQPRSPWSWVALVFLGLQNCLSANQASLLSSAAALGLIHLFAPRKKERSSDQNDAWIMLACVLLIPAVLTAAIAPSPILPRYPKSSHVVPYDGVESALQPLIGPTYSFESIHHGLARGIYSYGAMVLLVASTLLYFLGKRSGSQSRSIILRAALILAAVAVLDTWLNHSWSSIAPIASVSRLLPWASHYSLLSVALGAAAWGLGYAAVTGRALLTAPVCTVIVILLAQHGSRELYHPLLRRSGLVDDPQLAHILHSPSAGMIKFIAEHQPPVTEWLASVQAAAKLHSRDTTSIGAQVTIEPAPSTETLAQAKQIETAWRWSTRTGAQRGNELLTVKFVQPLKLRGVELDPGVYFTDYPRGLKILGGDCKRAQPAELIYDAPTWQGAVNLTTRGVPYFTPRNNVRVIFPKQTPAIECLFVQQTGKAQNDWSISRVRVIE